MITEIQENRPAKMESIEDRKIVYRKDVPTDMGKIVKCAELASEYYISKYNINGSERDFMINDTTKSLVKSIMDRDPDVFVRAAYVTGCKGIPCGVLIGSYDKIIGVSMSHVLYVEKKYRCMGVERRLINSFWKWGNGKPKNNGVFAMEPVKIFQYKNNYEKA